MSNDFLRAAAFALAAFLFPQPFPAQTDSAPPPEDLRRHDPVRTRSLRVRATVRDGVASTEIDEVLRNEGGADAEAVWLLPLPQDAVADGFTMTVGDREVQGEVLDARRAQEVYESIVRRRRDPGLLEYFGEGCLRARVFPIPARGEVTIKVRFRHVLAQHGGMHEWRFPLRAFAASGRRPERVSLDVELSASTDLKNVFAPGSGLQVVRRGERGARISAEWRTAADVPDRDLLVLYSLSEAEFGLNVLGYRRAPDDGYCMLLLSPRRTDANAKPLPRTIQFVLDTSGSMAGRKIEQARNAVRWFLQSLAPHDRFNVVPFATEAEPFFPDLVPADEERIAAAAAKVKRIEARGGTNIEDALRRALAAAAGDPRDGVLPIVVFVTDGEPTVGQTDREKLLALAAELNRGKARLFVLGVGDDLDTKLLDRLADDNGGARDYVRQDEDIEVKTSDLFTKLSRPVLTDLALEVDGVALRDQQPRRLPDLFAGSQLVVLARYEGSGRKTLRLRGSIGSERVSYEYEAHFPEHDTVHGFVPTLWAQRKVATLLDAIRLHGRKGELVEEVRRLAKEFGLVTPFTSHLIVEEGERLSSAAPPPPTAIPERGAVPRDRVPGSDPAADARALFGRLGQQEAGRDAVAESVAIRRLQVAGDRGETTKEAKAGSTVLVQRAGAKTFYRVGDRWIDQTCPTDWPARATKVVAFSAEYFRLLAAHRDLAPAFALGSRLVLMVGDRVLEIVPEQG